MKKILFLVVALGCVVLALSAVVGAIVLIVKIIKNGFSSEKKQVQLEETRMIQDIYKGLAKMEDRMDALETILMDKEGKENIKND